MLERGHHRVILQKISLILFLFLLRILHNRAISREVTSIVMTACTHLQKLFSLFFFLLFFCF